jgi:hypothetical protein
MGGEGIQLKGMDLGEGSDESVLKFTIVMVE